MKRGTFLVRQHSFWISPIINHSAWLATGLCCVANFTNLSSLLESDKQFPRKARHKLPLLVFIMKYLMLCACLCECITYCDVFKMCLVASNCRCFQTRHLCQDSKVSHRVTTFHTLAASHGHSPLVWGYRHRTCNCDIRRAACAQYIRRPQTLWGLLHHTVIRLWFLSS